MELLIGEIIKQEFEKSGLSASQFARMLNKERSLVYHLFKRQSIDTELLYQICLILNVDFFKLFTDKLIEANPVIRNDYEQRAKALSVSPVRKKIMIEVEVNEDEYYKLLNDRS